MKAVRRLSMGFDLGQRQCSATGTTSCLQSRYQVATNAVAVGWPAVVGQQYQLQGNIDLGTSNWVNLGGLINARLTNVDTQVSMTNSMQFYRLIQSP
jgi:predicted acyltransferase (DUF342 family)